MKKFINPQVKFFRLKQVLSLALIVFISSFSVAFAASHKHASKSKHPAKPVSRESLLKKSQISYRAEGGFTKVNAYSVIISCVDGKISTLSSITDKRIKHTESATLRKPGTMDKEDYLNLWQDLQRMAVLTKKDAPAPRMDILDEFTVTFEARVGDKKNEFKVHGCARPEVSQYFALRSRIDQAVQMPTLWSTHEKLALK